LFHDGFVHHIRDSTAFPGGLSEYELACSPEPAPRADLDLPTSAPSAPWHRTASLYASKLHEQARGMRRRGAKDHVTERCGTRRSHIIIRLGTAAATLADVGTVPVRHHGPRRRRRHHPIRILFESRAR
jgi:hypothetical protein